MRWFTEALAFIFLLGSATANAQSVPQAALRQAVAIVVARGVNQSDSTPVESQGTGFFINSMGLLVTAYHLRENLGSNVHAPSISYEVHFDAFGSAVPATQVYASPEADILILYVPVSGRSVGVLKPAFPSTAKIEIAKTTVYAASFAAGFDFSMTPAVIISLSGPIRPIVVPAWTTNVSFAEGQSGSPVVLADGRVVAIVKGADAGGASMGVIVPVMFIPTQFWDAQSSSALALSNFQAGAEPARLVVSRTVLSAEPRQIVRTVTLTRDPCDPRVEQRLHISASPGSEIDPASVKMAPRSFTGKEVRSSAVTNIAPNGFDITAQIVPAGVCVRFLAGRAAGLAAKLETEVRYVEHFKAPRSRQVVVAETAVVPGLDLPVGMSVRGLNFSIVSAGGNSASFTPSSTDLKTVNGQKVLDVSRAVSKIK